MTSMSMTNDDDNDVVIVDCYTHYTHLMDIHDQRARQLSNVTYVYHLSCSHVAYIS